MADPVKPFSTAPPPPKGQAEPLIVIPGDKDQERGYRVGVWGRPPNQWPNYECIYCQYRTLWLTKMQKHQLQGDHPWAFPGQNPKTPGVPSRDSKEPEYE